MHGLDAARAVAIIGMLAVNVGPDPNGGIAGLIYDLPRGRASLLFMILAGVGMSLMTQSSRLQGAPLRWRTIVWRAALLFSSGLALQLLNHEVSVILTNYGILFLLGLPLLRAPAWLLTTVATVMLVVGPVVWVLLQMWSGTVFDFESPSMLDSPGVIAHEVLLSGAYPVLVWIVPFIIGLIVGRLALRSRRVQWQLIGWGAAATVGGYVLSRGLIALLGEPAQEIGLSLLISAVDHSQMPLWLVTGGGSAVLVIGLFLRAEAWVRDWLSALVAAGRLSLTVYVVHLFVLALLVRPGPDTLAGGYAVTIIMSAVLIAASHLWWRKLGVGPLERLLTWPPLRSSRN